MDDAEEIRKKSSFVKAYVLIESLLLYCIFTLFVVYMMYELTDDIKHVEYIHFE